MKSGQIEDRHVRIESLSQGDRLSAVGGLTHDFEPFLLEEAFHALANHWSIVSQEYSA